MSNPENILFPSENRPSQAPDWYRNQVSQAEQRLMGQHGGQDAASALFPNDKPAAPPSEKPVQAKAPEDVAAGLFHTERKPDLHSRAVESVIEPLAEAARLQGDQAKADEWREASRTLTEDFRQSGMDADEVGQVMELAKEALSNTLPGMPVDEDRLLHMQEQGEAWMIERGVTDAEIDAARRMIDDLELRTPGLKDYLNATGLGSDPRAIEKAIREARRRGYV